MTDGKIMQKQAVCHGYKMMELSNGDVQVINPAGLPIARTVSFREAVKIIETDVKYLIRYSEQTERRILFNEQIKLDTGNGD